MESLPEEMIGEICQYLSASDLASCCAVSHGWREMFGEDRLWQVHCDEAVSEHLDVNNCVVEPHFTSPEAADSTLSAIGEWRLNYMKEVHVRNNFRSGNFKKEELYEKTDNRRYYARVVIFFDNDHFLMLNQNNELEIWDVKKESALKAKFSFTLLLQEYPPTTVHPQNFCELFPVNGTNTFVAVDVLFVRVYSLCVDSYTITLLHLFQFDMPEKFPDSTEDLVQELFTSHSVYVPFKCSVVGHFFVGIRNRMNAIKLHIWNVETGEKLKEEERPPSTVYVQYIIACDKSMNILIEGAEFHEERGKGLGHWYVYSLKKLKFNPFHKVHELNDVILDCPGLHYHAVIFEKYVGILVDKTLSVYDAVTSELLYTAPCDWHPFWYKHYLVFQYGFMWNIYNPRKHSSTADSNPSNMRFNVRHSGNTSVKCISFRIKDGSENLYVPDYKNACSRPGSFNRSHTKFVNTVDDCDSTKVIVVHFW